MRMHDVVNMERFISMPGKERTDLIKALIRKHEDGKMERVYRSSRLYAMETLAKRHAGKVIKSIDLWNDLCAANVNITYRTFGIYLVRLQHRGVLKHVGEHGSCEYLVIATNNNEGGGGREY